MTSLMRIFTSAALVLGFSACNTTDRPNASSAQGLVTTDGSNAFLFYVEPSDNTRICIAKCSKAEFDSVKAKIVNGQYTHTDAIQKLKTSCVRHGSITKSDFDISVSASFRNAVRDENKLYAVSSSNSSYRNLLQSNKIMTQPEHLCPFPEDDDVIVPIGEDDDITPIDGGGGGGNGGGGNGGGGGGNNNGPCTPTTTQCDSVCPQSGNKQCRVLDCHGVLISTYNQACTPPVCQPTSTKCDTTCPDSGQKRCRVFDCNNMVVNEYYDSCTPPPPTYSCSSCSKTTSNCTYTGSSWGETYNNGTIECYNVTRTSSGHTTQIDKFCTPCGHWQDSYQGCDRARDSDFRCR